GRVLYEGLFRAIAGRPRPGERERPGEAPAVLRGVRLAARTMEHRLNNQLARTMAHCELLAEDPRLPEDARERARRAMAGTAAADATTPSPRSSSRTVISPPAGEYLPALAGRFCRTCDSRWMSHSPSTGPSRASTRRACPGASARAWCAAERTRSARSMRTRR